MTKTTAGDDVDTSPRTVCSRLNRSHLLDPSCSIWSANRLLESPTSGRINNAGNGIPFNVQKIQFYSLITTSQIYHHLKCAHHIRNFRIKQTSAHHCWLHSMTGSAFVASTSSTCCPTGFSAGFLAPAVNLSSASVSRVVSPSSYTTWTWLFIRTWRLGADCVGSTAGSSQGLRELMMGMSNCEIQCHQEETSHYSIVD